MAIRAAGPDDVPAMVAVMSAAPTREVLALFGDERRARAFQRELFGSALERPGNVVLVAEDAGDVVGFALVSDGSDTPPPVELVRIAVRSLGLRGALATAWRSRARNAVDLDPPPGGLHLVELQVDPTRRGRGVGGTLIEAAEDHARNRGASHLSLTTGIDNPARRLYERHGYELEDERSDPAYTRLTGSLGRVLLVKHLV